MQCGIKKLIMIGQIIVKKLKEILPKNKHKNIKIRLKPNEPIVDSRAI